MYPKHYIPIAPLSLNYRNSFFGQNVFLVCFSNNTYGRSVSNCNLHLVHFLSWSICICVSNFSKQVFSLFDSMLGSHSVATLQDEGSASKGSRHKRFSFINVFTMHNWMLSMKFVLHYLIALWCSLKFVTGWPDLHSSLNIMTGGWQRSTQYCRNHILRVVQRQCWCDCITPFVISLFAFISSIPR